MAGILGYIGALTTNTLDQVDHTWNLMTMGGSSTGDGFIQFSSQGRVLAALHALGVLSRETGEFLGLGFDPSDFMSTTFAVTGTRAFIVGNAALYAFDCPVD